MAAATLASVFSASARARIQSKKVPSSPVMPTRPEAPPGSSATCAAKTMASSGAGPWARHSWATFARAVWCSLTMCPGPVKAHNRSSSPVATSGRFQWTSSAATTAEIRGPVAWAASDPASTPSTRNLSTLPAGSWSLFSPGFHSAIIFSEGIMLEARGIAELEARCMGLSLTDGFADRLALAKEATAPQAKEYRFGSFFSTSSSTTR
mmetsp:Transcript_15885/g.40356  ORF Transcript_15885/g.40356 Transcript_15885/m.40356 type:complete len:208 (+) Transcript_15885:1403-2026(+)